MVKSSQPLEHWIGLLPQQQFLGMANVIVITIQCLANDSNSTYTLRIYLAKSELEITADSIDTRLVLYLYIYIYPTY